MKGDQSVNARPKQWPKQTWPGDIEVAWRIHRDSELPQDLDVQCPIKADGQRCQWVAGHYGGHALN